MNKSIQNKLLFSKTKPTQLFIALFGAFLGLVIVMAGFQTYRNTMALMKQKDMLGGDYIVINKKVSLLNTLSGSASSFSTDEIEELKKNEAIDNVGEFTPGSFSTLMELDPKMAEMAGPGLKTDMFFEAVPNNFVDIDSAEWQWKPGDKDIPIIIPSDYIKLYNLAFAQSQGLPVIPESMIKTVSFRLRIRGAGKEDYMSGRIAGFSERINSILVPQSFLEWGNKQYGNKGKRSPSRLILHSKDPASPALSKFITDNGYELNEEKLKASKMNGILQIILSIVAMVGALIVILALLGFMQYNQLLAYRSAYEIQTLHWLGFSVGQLSLPYIRFICISVLSTMCFAMVTVVFFQYYIGYYLKNKGFEVELPSIIYTIAAGFVISLLMIVVSVISTRRQVAQLVV